MYASPIESLPDTPNGGFLGNFSGDFVAVGPGEGEGWGEVTRVCLVVGEGEIDVRVGTAACASVVDGERGVELRFGVQPATRSRIKISSETGDLVLIFSIY
jgi:hypothetical protein